jgi:surface antigen
MTVPTLAARPYSRSSRSRRPAAAVAGAALAGLALSACSLSMPLGGGLGLGDRDPQTTASIAHPAPTPPAAPVGTVDAAPLPSLPAHGGATATAGGIASGPASAFAATGAAGSTAFSPADWVYARGALGLALSGTAEGPPVPWANPETGTYGSFAPAAPATVANGETCRSFVAERVKTGATEHFKGRACRSDGGGWTIAELATAPATL